MNLEGPSHKFQKCLHRNFQRRLAPMWTWNIMGKCLCALLSPWAWSLVWLPSLPVVFVVVVLLVSGAFFWGKTHVFWHVCHFRFFMLLLKSWEICDIICILDYCHRMLMFFFWFSIISSCIHSSRIRWIRWFFAVCSKPRGWLKKAKAEANEMLESLDLFINSPKK